MRTFVSPIRSSRLSSDTGTTSRQRRVFASLGDLHLATKAEGLKSPTLVVIGNCVALSPLWPAADLATADRDGGAEQPQPWVLQSGSVGSGVYLGAISGGLATDAAVHQAAASIGLDREEGAAR